MGSMLCIESSKSVMIRAARYTEPFVAARYTEPFVGAMYIFLLVICAFSLIRVQQRSVQQYTPHCGIVHRLKCRSHQQSNLAADAGIESSG